MKVLTRKIKFSAFFLEALALGARNITPIGLATIGLAVFYTILDKFGHATMSSGQSVISIIAGYPVLRRVLHSEKLIETEGKIPAFLIVSLLSGFAALPGFVLFIVPGFYLLARWSAAPVLTVARGRRAIEAMRESWAMTADSAWTLVLVYCVFGIAALVGIFATAALGLAALGLGAQERLSFLFATNMLVAFLSIGAICLNAAVYCLLTGGGTEVEEVFA
jgi:hypothetical protein